MDQNFAWLFLEAAIFFSICFHNFVLMKRLKIWNNAHNAPFSLWKAWICLLYKWWLIHDPNKVLNISYKQWQWLKERKSFNQSSFLSFFFSLCVCHFTKLFFLPKCLQGGGVPGTAHSGADSSQGQSRFCTFSSASGQYYCDCQIQN